MKVVAKELDQTDIEILTMLKNGIPVKKIAYNLNKSVRTITNRIKAMKDYYECENITSLVCKLLSEIA